MKKRAEVSDELHGALIIWGSIAIHLGTWITLGFGPMLMLGGAITLVVAMVTA